MNSWSFLTLHPPTPIVALCDLSFPCGRKGVHSSQQFWIGNWGSRFLMVFNKLVSTSLMPGMMSNNWVEDRFENILKVQTVFWKDMFSFRKSGVRISYIKTFGGLRGRIVMFKNAAQRISRTRVFPLRVPPRITVTLIAFLPSAFFHFRLWRRGRKKIKSRGAVFFVMLSSQHREAVALSESYNYFRVGRSLETVSFFKMIFVKNGLCARSSWLAAWSSTRAQCAAYYS
jgi:hypothetical protein